jgi:single-strand DNA-binding protein
MASINKAILIGNLGGDPELRYTSNGTAVASFNIATTERYKDKNGEQQERTEWHSIVCWGRMGELANEYLRKGRSVYIEGRIQTRNYEDKDGIKRYKTEIVAQQMQFLGGRGQESSQAARSDDSSATQPEPEIPADDDDLPF